MDTNDNQQGQATFKESASKPLDDLRYIINNIMIPLEKKENFKKNLENFEANIKYSLNQVDNKVSLNSIDLPRDMSDDMIAKDTLLIRKLDKLVDDWSSNIEKAINSLNSSRTEIKSASMEIENRRRIVSNLSILAQQLKSDSIKRIMNIIYSSEESQKKGIFKANVQKFEKAFEDASDYLKFLTTLERSIKDLSSDNLATIEHSISGIFHNLKIIHMISNHKNDQNKLGFLMEVMSREICDRISDRIRLREIFKNPEESIFLIDQATSVVQKWKSCYNDTKNKTKWDYLNTNITGGTDYIFKICNRLKQGLIKIKDFLKFLGPELKRVIGGSSEKIEKEREKIYQAYSFIEQYPHNIFNKMNEESCNNAFSNFDAAMKGLEVDTIKLIDETFRDLRSAESAYDLYINFENLIKQPEIKEAMNKKYINILKQFMKEIKEYLQIFELNKDDPPISKAKSEVAGKIAWARLLYLKMRRPLSKIFNTTKIKNINSGENKEQEICEKELTESFFEIGRKLRDYETKIYENWKKECESKFMSYLRNNILVKSSKSYEIKYDPNLKLMIRNTKFLDLYGYNDIPKNIINIAHQEAQLAKYCNDLNLMLRDYDNFIGLLNQQHHDLLKNDIAKLVAKIEVGTTSHNWTSLGIDEFIVECLNEIKILKDKANSVFKSEDKIRNILKQIGNSNLVKQVDLKKSDNKELTDFFAYYDDHKDKIKADLLNKYEDITGIICEIEKSTFENSNKDEVGLQLANKNQKKTVENLGENPAMAGYYRFWELSILNVLTKTILKAIITLYELFSMPRQDDNQNILFTIKSKFISSKEIMYNLNTLDIDQMLKKLIGNFQNSGNDFLRWMSNTCRTPDVTELIEERLEAIASKYSYGAEINTNEDIKFYIQKLYTIVQKIDENLNNNKAKYTREYQRDYFGHWGPSRSKMEIQLERNKSLKNFEIKLNDIIDYLEDFKKNFSKRRIIDGNCEINNEELINKGVEQIQKIMNDMLKILAKQVEEEDVKKLMDSIDNSKDKLREKITDSDTLKKVLDYISKISNKKLSMELKIRDIEEKLHFLYLHNYPGLNDISDKFEVMKMEWSNLRVKAIKKDGKLLTKKKNLAEETKRDVEILKEDVAIIYKQYKENGPTTEKIDLAQGYHLLKEYNEKLQVLKDKRNNIVECQRLFNLSITTFFEINEMCDLNAKVEPVYIFYKEFTDFYDEQLFKPWGKIEINVLDKEDEIFQDKMKEFKRMQLASLSPYRKLDEIKEKYHEILNDVIKPLKNPIITERNLKELMIEIRRSITINFQTTTLKEILALDLLKEKEKIFNLVNDASKENDIKTKLQEIEKVLEALNFQIKPYKRGNEDKGFIFKDVSEEQALLQENITNLQQFSNNKHAGAFKPQIIELEQEMNLIMEIIEIWVEVQKKWMYLESIFVGSEDIRQKLPDEAKEFDEYDRKFRLIMTSVQKKPSIRFQCKEKDRKFELKNKILAKFEQAEKKLTEHLDSKKNEFSRFYFLTEQDLLQILGSSDPLATLNPHMIKLYENCKELVSEKKNIVGMKSSEEEMLYFEKPIRIESQQQVGLWMNKVDEEMKSCLKEYTREAIQDFTKEELFKFIKSKIGMVIVNTVECWWTFSLEDVFRKVKEGDKYAMKKELERQTNFVLSLVKTVRRPELQIRDRMKLNNLIIRVVHGREIVDKFVRDSILDAREFEWESQLKFYWDKRKDDIIIRQCNGEFFSCYEYQGLQSRLVVTPLTDRCVMTLTTALTFFLGGAPAGPAGTGKTETVKDLGKGLGIRVVVQNCTNTLDYLFMGQFFSGLSQTGFWGCFDEFNRINREVLSVITTQIKSIQNALMQKKESWILLTKEVKLLPTIGIYITMNPNYEGRSELPDNLKALFRPVTMVTPDQLLICENMLLSEGFHDSKKLARKIDKLYQLSKEQLSKQHHYEWGLRSIKSVLSAAGLLKRQNPDMPEDLILMKAMRDINMPKFINDDAILFEGLIKDLFPTLDTNENDGEEFKTLIQNVTKALNYEIIEGQTTKVQQMYEVMNIRHSTLICGPPVSGKSCILDILRKTIEQLKSLTLTTYLINPKAQTIPRLYGVKNEMTGDFEIGILANIFAIANQPLNPGKNELRWVLLDGDIDPIWIENMNSVMDDSKCLTLENKDRILMQKYCSLLLESSNIHHASLATVSRLGMIYVDGAILKFDSVFMRWLAYKNPADWEEATRENLILLFKRYALQLIKYIEKGMKGNIEDGLPLKTAIKQYGASMIKQLCTLLDSMLPKENPPTEISQLEPIFVFCLTWSLGACLQSQEREKFSKYIRELSAGGSSLSSNLFDKMFDANTGKFEDWDGVKGIIEETTGAGLKFNDIIIPTLDTKRYSYMVKQLINIKMPILFVGESGTGKTVTIQNYLKQLTSGHNKSNHLILNINFSSRTTAMDFQLNLEDNLETRLMRTVGPPSGKELIVFIDDLGMPTVDKYETQQPIAFLKLLIEKKNYYTKDNKDLIKLVDTNFIGSTLPPGAGNNEIDPRFVALFNVFNITAEQNAIQKIYNTILGNYLNVYPTEAELGGFSEKLIHATSELFNSIKEKLPRTPIKFHYVFNIRDISKIFQGFCQLTQTKFPNKESLIKLWKNECLRVFSDKLRTVEDKRLVEQLLDENLQRNFPENVEYVKTGDLIYGDFLRIQFEDEDDVAEDNQKAKEMRFYEHIESYENLKPLLDKALEAYKYGGNQPMELVFYNDAVDHLVRISRIIRMEMGNCLLVGVGGSGKQSLAKLASFIARYELWGIKITSRFEEKHFREQLIELFKRFDETGEITPISFLFTDEHVLDEGFMELINNILTTGIVPAIFEKSDKDAIIEKWKSEASKNMLPETKDVAYSLYVNKIKQNLHMIIAMSPSGDKLRNRCRNFPGLISNTTIDWFFEWPKEALNSVSHYLLANYKEISDDSKATICDHIIETHLSVRDFCEEALQVQKRHIYTTPKNFLDYIKNFKKLYRDYHDKVLGNIERLEKGLEVLSISSENIGKLKIDVQEKEQKVSSFLQELEIAKVELDDKTKICEEKTKNAKEKAIYLEKRSAEIAREQVEIEKNVEETKLLIEKISKDVQDIPKTSVEQFGRKTKFEDDTGFILKCLYYSMKEKSNNVKWDNVPDSDISSFLSKTTILLSKMKEINKTYNEVGIPQTEIAAQKVQQVTVDGDKNKALYLIQQYVINFNKFVKRTAEKIEAETNLNKKIQDKENAMNDLEKTNSELKILTEEMIKLQADTEEKDREFKKTNEEVQNLRITLSAAEELFEGLKSEEVRWSKDRENLKISKEKLIGDVLLSSAFLSYCGPFSYEFRKRIIYQRWRDDIVAKNINISENFTVAGLLADELTISRWNLEGLPDDELSVQNGILTVNASRWPLCVDPEMQAINWIKKKEGSTMKTISFNNDNYMKHVIGAIKNGYSVLIENVGESIDPNISPVLEKNYREKAGIIKIILDGTEIDVDPRFRLFMTSKLSNPHYTPEIMAKTVVINYSATMDGLEEQLLNEVVRHESPDTEERRKRLVDEINQNKITLKLCEDSLLEALSKSDGEHILEDQHLILTLKETKKKAMEVKILLDNAESTKVTIYHTRNNYKAVAKRGSILYFTMTGLRLISSMYEYSLNAFLSVFRNALDDAKPDLIINNRLENIKRKLTQLVYEYTCLSIFERHKLMFSFHLRTMIMKYEENLDQEELLFFLRGNLLEPKSKNPFDWLSEIAWQDLDGLINLSSTFKSLYSDVTKNEDEWRAWYDLEKPEDSSLPQEYDKKLSLLQKLLIIRVFRKDRIFNSIKNFIRTTMGEFFINAPPINMDKIFAQSSEKIPILFILSPGVDPNSYVTQLAIKKGFYEKKLRAMSLGQKQEKEATDMIQEGVKRGLWVLLQNCDLLKDWLKDLENIIDNIDKPKQDFRLWLTTSPIDEFPIGILQKSFKVVTEPPDGLQLNISRIYSSIPEENFESESNHFAYKPLVFVLSFFHSVLQDRKKFGKIGWNVFYDFNESDFTISRRLLAMYLNKITADEPIPWSSLKYLIGEAMYGGRVTDDYDRRIMMTYLNEYMGDFIFDTNQKFFFSKSGHEYSIPEAGPYDSYLKFISEMPPIYSPEVIGLHSNAEIDYFTQSSKLIWQNLLVLQATGGKTKPGDKSSNKEQFSLELAENLLHNKIKEKFDLQSISSKFKSKSPIDAVLIQELERFNLLIEKMIRTLTDLKKSINGEISMNSEIEEIMISLFNGAIPNQWKNIAPETQKSLGNWIDHFQKRYDQYEKWANDGEPKVMWLSGLHIPGSYLKAIIQTTSRKKGWALDKVDTYTVVTKIYNLEEIKDKPEHGCYISGLYLEGAEWNSELNSLEKQQAKKLLCDMPLIQVIPAEASKIKLRNNLKTPVYMTQNRRNIRGEGLVFEADLRTVVHPNTWVLQGVCLVLNTYYG